MTAGRVWQAVAVLWLLGLLVPDAWRGAHLVLVRHVVCPDDGALVHEDEVSGAARAREAAPAPTKRTASVTQRHQHEGCSALTWVDRPAATLAVSPVALRHVLSSYAASESAPSSPDRPCVLSYAPKLSPPA